MEEQDIQLSPEENDRFWDWLNMPDVHNPKWNSPIDDIRSMLAALPQEKEQGRNEPCNCGSGLKYKKCCGK